MSAILIKYTLFHDSVNISTTCEWPKRNVWYSYTRWDSNEVARTESHNMIPTNQHTGGVHAHALFLWLLSIFHVLTTAPSWSLRKIDNI